MDFLYNECIFYAYTHHAQIYTYTKNNLSYIEIFYTFSEQIKFTHFLCYYS